MVTMLLRPIYDTYVLLQVIYELFTENVIRGQSQENFWHVQNFASTFTDLYEYLRVSASRDELLTDTNELCTDACDWLRVRDP